MRRGTTLAVLVVSAGVASPTLSAQDRATTPALTITEFVAASARPPAPPSDGTVGLFVRADTRDGFLDVDRGVLDSIKDLQAEFRHNAAIRLVTTEQEAHVVLVVVARGAAAGDAGAVAVPVGTATMVLPMQNQALITKLRVPAPTTEVTFGVPLRMWFDQKSITFDHCDAWRICAREVAKDVAVWIDANRATLLNSSRLP